MVAVEQAQGALDGRAIQVGQTRVLAARVRPGKDADGDPVLLVRIILSNPANDAETWPTEDIVGIRRAIRDALEQADPGPQLPWVISFEPENAMALDPDDAAGEIHIDF